MVQQLPDAEVLFRTWALAQSEISSLVGTRIATRLPNGGTLPFLVVAQLGGAPSADGLQHMPMDLQQVQTSADESQNTISFWL